ILSSYLSLVLIPATPVPTSLQCARHYENLPISASRWYKLEIDHCSFPDHLLYDQDGNIWIKAEEGGEETIGITSLLSAIAGKVTSARLRPVGSRIERGRSLGTLESLKFVGPIPSPLSGIVAAANSDVVKRPKLLNDAPYIEGESAKVKQPGLKGERGC